MMPRIVACWRLLLWQVPNGAILAALVGLYLWGHHYHWRAPFSLRSGAHSEAGRPEANGTAPGSAGAVTHTAAKTDGSSARRFRVDFRTCAAVRKAGIQMEAVQELALSEFVAAPGEVDYAQTQLAQLSCRVPGSVWSVDKRVGDVVRAGDVLAIIEAADVGKAKAEFLQAVAHLDLKTRVYQRLTPSVVPARSIDEAAAAVQEARIRLFNARQALNNLGLTIRKSDVTDVSPEELARRLRFLGLPPELVRTLDPETGTANLLPLVAPFDGVVIGREVVVGEMVKPGDHQFVLADVSRMWLSLDVRLEDIHRVRVGQECRFTPDTGPGEEVKGVIDWISTSADAKTRTVPVRASVANPDGRLRANTFGTGRILVNGSPRAVAVPSRAIQSLDGGPVVFICQADQSFEARRVDLGIRGDGFTEVRTGLRPGDRVATTGSHLLKSEILRRRQAAYSVD